jgi:hypothetical protein
MACLGLKRGLVAATYPRHVLVPRWTAALLASGVAMAIAGCEPAPPSSAASPGARSESVASAENGGPITGLPACGPPPDAADEEPVAGVPMLEDMVITAVERGDPLTTVHGYVGQTPVQVRRYLESRGLRVLNIEDEVTESEALVSNGQQRVYVKASAVCDLGSKLLVVVAPEVAGQAVPAPRGG